MSQTALNNRWQQFRDNEFWARTTSRDNDQYAKKVAYASFIYGKSADDAFASKVGNLAFDTVAGLGSAFKDEIASGITGLFSGGSDVDMGISSTFIDSDTFAGDTFDAVSDTPSFFSFGTE